LQKEVKLMTELLEKAITAIKNLPDDSQNAIAVRLLDEITDDLAWSARFLETTDDQWDNMADSVRCGIAAGKTVPLDEIFPRITNS
jgi:hypothetical protein